MHAFSGYNQIKMEPVDQEKTAFIIDRGLYSYIAMPFGLKRSHISEVSEFNVQNIDRS
jgi:hypothetical protein